MLNEPQRFQEHFGDLPFFTSFPFGSVADGVNWFEAAGVPIAAFDDLGRENPYPLMRVEAHVGGNAVATLATVMPISGEAECQACHADPADGGNGSGVRNLGTVTTSIEGPAADVPGAISVEWASDRNILRLHDQKHGASLEGAVDPGTGRADDPVACQRCHCTPALDLAQLGPLGPENDGPATFPNGTSTPSLANGRDHIKHKSMSNVVHSHHATVTDADGRRPPVPGHAAGDQRPGPASQSRADQSILEEACYRCQPGKRTQCMRGAMANAGPVCQDCHGQMAQVGDDFSRNVSPGNPGALLLAADFYTSPATPRVAWADEPGCGSCHTGYATDNLAGTAGTLVNPTDTHGNTDGIRLLAAYRANDARATPIVPVNKAVAEDVVTVDVTPGDGHNPVGNPKLYRVSNGLAGLFCESCHGANLRGTVLSRTAADRSVRCKDEKGSLPSCAARRPTAVIPKGTPSTAASATARSDGDSRTGHSTRVSPGRGPPPFWARPRALDRAAVVRPCVRPSPRCAACVCALSEFLTRGFRAACA